MKILIFFGRDEESQPWVFAGVLSASPSLIIFVHWGHVYIEIEEESDQQLR